MLGMNTGTNKEHFLTSFYYVFIGYFCEVMIYSNCFSGQIKDKSTFLMDNQDILIKHSAIQRDRVSLPLQMRLVYEANVRG